MTSDIPARQRFEQAYHHRPPPWEIGRPQPAVTALGDRFFGSVLDAGCGTGENTLYLASRGLDVTGVDFLASPVEAARAKAAARGLTVDFRVQDALRLEELNRTFDCILDSGLFHVFPDGARDAYVRSLGQVSKVGCRLFLICFSDREPGDHGPRRVSETELSDAFPDSEWRVDELRPTRFAVRTDLEDIAFTEGGPHAWLAQLSRLSSDMSKT